MLDKNQLITIKWNPRNKKRYTDLGYFYTKMGDSFDIKLEHLPKCSGNKVKVLCDKCGKEKNIRYVDYWKYHHEDYGDLCKKCNRILSARTIYKKYGVFNPSQIEKVKAKKEATCLLHYKVANPFQAESIKQDIKEKVKRTIKEKYGYDYIFQVPEIKKKCRQSYYINGTCPTSKPQKELCDMLKDYYGNCELNYPCGNCSLDCRLIVNDVFINIEYDGKFWHNNPQSDRKRDEFVKSQGYKIIRIKGSHNIPSLEQIQSAIEKLINSEHKFIEIDMNI